MQLRFEWLALYVAVAALYLLLAWREWIGQRPGSERAPVWHGVVHLGSRTARNVLPLACSKPASCASGLRALSATLWLTALIVCVETMFSPSRGMFLLVLPLAAVATLLPALFPGAIVGRSSGAPLFQVHLLLAILAYSLLTIAAIHALLMATMERRLHGEAAGADASFVIDRLPPLLAMEACYSA